MFLEQYVEDAGNAEEIEDLEDEIRELEEILTSNLGDDPGDYDEPRRELAEKREELAALIAAANDCDTEDEETEIAALKALKEEAANYGWDDGILFIRSDEFEDYVKSYAEDNVDGSIRENRWPFNHIDWEAAADEFRQDYTSVEFDGCDYWYRGA